MESTFFFIIFNLNNSKLSSLHFAVSQPKPVPTGQNTHTICPS